jgi:hypothetical protein
VVAAPAHAQAPAFLVRHINTVQQRVVSNTDRLQIGTTAFFVASTTETGSEL